MSDWQTKWTKAQRDRCDFRGEQALFIVGVERAAGRFENSGIMDAAKAAFLLRIAGELYRGRPAQEAFNEAMAALSDMGREMIGRETRDMTASSAVAPPELPCPPRDREREGGACE